MESPSLSDEIRDEQPVAQAIRSLTTAATTSGRGFTNPPERGQRLPSPQRRRPPMVPPAKMCGKRSLNRRKGKSGITPV